MEVIKSLTIEEYNALSPEQRWEKMFEAATQYIQIENKMPPTDYIVNGVTLINWIRSHSSKNQKNEEKRNRVKAILADSGVLSTRDHWDTYFPLLQEHFKSKIPLRYSTNKKFQEWARDLKRRWQDENIEKNKKDLLIKENYEYLIVNDMLTYELLKEFHETCEDIELYKFNEDADEELPDNIEDTFDILSFLKRELVKRDNNELSEEKREVLSLFDNYNLKMTASQKALKIIIKEELGTSFTMYLVDKPLRNVFQMSLDNLVNKTNNNHYTLLVNILDSKNQTEIANMCGLSKERVRQLFNSAKEQFRIDLQKNIEMFKI